MDASSFLVRAGEKVRPVFNAFLDYLQSQRILGGRGVLINQQSKGVCISARSSIADFTGSFAVRLNGASITVGLGLVGDGNGITLEPQIGGRPISGNDSAGTPPELKLNDALWTPEGWSWIALCVTSALDTGKLLKADIRQVTKLVDGNHSDLGFDPLALLIKNKKTGQITLHQIQFFDRRHTTARDAAGRYRHFFDLL